MSFKDRIHWQMTRRESLKILGAAGLSLALPPCLAHSDTGAGAWPNISAGLRYDSSLGDPLAKPWKLGGVKIKNRIAKSAMGEARASENGFVTKDYVRFYERFAQGGAGLLITGNMYTQAPGAGAPRHIVLGNDDKIPGLEKVSKAVHSKGGIIFAQINDAGASANRTKPWAGRRAPSAVSRPFWRRARPMNEKDIEEAIRGFARAAVRIQKAGFDGVEIHGAHGYLISQFLDITKNRRTDLWGGNQENRHRFALEVIKEVRGAVGKSFPVIIKINGDNRGEEDSEDRRDQVVLVRKLDGLGVDGFDVSCGGRDSITGTIQGMGTFKENRNLPAARTIKKAVTKPVFVVGGIRDPEAMRVMVQQNYVDAVSLGRPILRDPDYPKRILKQDAGRSQCVNANECILKTRIGPAKCWNVASDPFSV